MKFINPAELKKVEDEYSDVCYECTGMGNNYYFDGEGYISFYPICCVTKQREFKEWMVSEERDDLFMLTN